MKASEKYIQIKHEQIINMVRSKYFTSIFICCFTSCPAWCEPFFCALLNCEMLLNQWFCASLHKDSFVWFYIIVYSCYLFVTFSSYIFAYIYLSNDLFPYHWDSLS